LSLIRTLLPSVSLPSLEFFKAILDLENVGSVRYEDLVECIKECAPMSSSIQEGTGKAEVREMLQPMASALQVYARLRSPKHPT
jgi:hypothetical protein